MFHFSAKILKASAWSGRDPKIHLDEVRSMAQRVWNELISQFQILKKHYNIKGAPLEDWLDHYGVGPLMHSKDAAVMRGINHIRKTLQESVKPSSEGGKFRSNEIQAFKQHYGTNVTDWLFRLTDEFNKSASFNSHELEFSPVEFEDVEVIIYDKGGNPMRTHSVSGEAVRNMNNDIEISLLPESTEGLTEEELNSSEIPIQVIQQIQNEVPQLDELVYSSKEF